MKHTYALGLLLALSVMSPLSTLRAAETPKIILSEIAWAGSEKSTADEWIEIRNTGSEAVDISGWSLTGVGTSGSAITIPSTSSLAAGSAYLIANYAMTDAKTTLVVAPNLVTTAVSIPNTALNIVLLDSTGAIIDSLVDPGTPNFGSSTTFSTMKRDSSSGAWFTESASTNISHVTAPSPVTPPEIPAPAAIVTDAVPQVITSSTPVASDPVVPEAVAQIAEPANPVAIEASPTIIESITTPPVVDPVVSDVITTPRETINAEPSVSEPPVAPIAIEAAPEATVTETLRITGILSSPSTGNDEWVELTNFTQSPVALEAFTLIDASGKITALSGVLDAGATQRILNPNGKLNNDGDSITLLNGESIIDSLVYGTDALSAPKKDFALLLVNNEWIAQDESLATTVTEAEAAPATAEVTVTEAVPATESIVAPATAPSTSITAVTTPSAATVSELTTPAASSQTPSSEPTSSTVTIGDIVINEILSSPSTGYDEWVELKNVKNSSVSLNGLSLVDASGKETHLSGTIDPSGYTLIPNPTGNLNNDAESVTLMNGSVVIDSISYGNDTNAAPKKDVTLARINGTWVMATPTPGTENAQTASASETLTPTLSPNLYANATPVTPSQQATNTTDTNATAHSSGATPTVTRHVVAAVQSIATADPTPTSTSVKTSTKTTKAKGTVKKSSTSTTSSVRSVTIDDIANLADGTKVKLEGVVVATAGAVGKRSFFVDGLEIYQSTGVLGDVKIGDRISITGEVSVLSDHRRVNIQEGTVRVINHVDPIVHDYASALPYGSLARITGTISARDGNAVLLNTDSGTIKITPGNGVTVVWANLAGTTVTVTGILKHGDQETLVLRSADDVMQPQVAQPTSSASIAEGTAASSSSLLWMTGALLALGSAGFGTWVWYTRPKARTAKLILHPTAV